jgi:hypothetical protein
MLMKAKEMFVFNSVTEHLIRYFHPIKFLILMRKTRKIKLCLNQRTQKFVIHTVPLRIRCNFKLT